MICPINFSLSYSPIDDPNLYRLPVIIVQPSIVQGHTHTADVHIKQCPAYITEAITSVCCGQSQSDSDGTNYITPRTRTRFGERPFSVAGPSIWISLPKYVSSATRNLHCFKHHLKTHYVHIHSNTS